MREDIIPISSITSYTQTPTNNELTVQYVIKIDENNQSESELKVMVKREAADADLFAAGNRL